MELWWKVPENCPALAIVVIYYLCIPASSSALKRLLSQTGLIQSKLRNRTIAKLMYLHPRQLERQSLPSMALGEDGWEESKDGKEEEENEDEMIRWEEMEEGTAGKFEVFGKNNEVAKTSSPSVGESQAFNGLLSRADRLKTLDICVA
ncbi:hypothetical protein VYU27_000625 [Nannochloropsis oceanica]